MSMVDDNEKIDRHGPFRSYAGARVASGWWGVARDEGGCWAGWGRGRTGAGDGGGWQWRQCRQCNRCMRCNQGGQRWLGWRCRRAQPRFVGGLSERVATAAMESASKGRPRFVQRGRLRFGRRICRHKEGAPACENRSRAEQAQALGETDDGRSVRARYRATIDGYRGHATDIRDESRHSLAASRHLGDAD